MERHAAVYLILNTVNGKFYVGKSVNPDARWKRHRHVARRGPDHREFKVLHAAMRKYGIENFRFDVLEWFDSEGEAYWFEEWWVDYLRSDLPGYGYNLREGGRGGWTLPPETRERIAAKLRGRKHTPERAAKVAAAHRGKVISPEHRAKLSMALKGRPRPAEVREKIAAAHRGVKLSPEHVEKMRERGKVQGFSPQAREAQIRANTGRKARPESIAKGRATRLAKRERETSN
jgi:group I intron endonuclease